MNLRPQDGGGKASHHQSGGSGPQHAAGGYATGPGCSHTSRALGTLAVGTGNAGPPAPFHGGNRALGRRVGPHPRFTGLRVGERVPCIRAGVTTNPLICAVTSWKHWGCSRGPPGSPPGPLYGSHDGSPTPSGDGFPPRRHRAIPQRGPQLVKVEHQQQRAQGFSGIFEVGVGGLLMGVGGRGTHYS
jgi:hypothetical protein